MQESLISLASLDGKRAAISLPSGANAASMLELGRRFRHVRAHQELAHLVARVADDEGHRAFLARFKHGQRFVEKDIAVDDRG